MLTDTKLVGTFHNMYLYDRVPEVTDRRWHFTPRGPKLALLRNYCRAQASSQFVTISLWTQKPLINWLSGGRKSIISRIRSCVASKFLVISIIMGKSRKIKNIKIPTTNFPTKCSA